MKVHLVHNSVAVLHPSESRNACAVTGEEELPIPWCEKPARTRSQRQWGGRRLVRTWPSHCMLTMNSLWLVCSVRTSSPEGSQIATANLNPARVQCEVILMEWIYTWREWRKEGGETGKDWLERKDEVREEEEPGVPAYMSPSGAMHMQRTAPISAVSGSPSAHQEGPAFLRHLRTVWSCPQERSTRPRNTKSLI